MSGVVDVAEPNPIMGRSRYRSHRARFADLLLLERRKGSSERQLNSALRRARLSAGHTVFES